MIEKLYFYYYFTITQEHLQNQWIFVKLGDSDFGACKTSLLMAIWVSSNTWASWN